MQSQLKTVQFDPTKYRLVPVEPTDKMLLDLMLLTEWGPFDPENGNTDQDMTYEGYSTMLAELPEPSADEVVELDLRERDAQLLEKVGQQFGADIQAALNVLAKAYRAGTWSPWPGVVKTEDQGNTEATVILKPGMRLGLGAGHKVGVLVEVTAAHADGFLFTVINGGWQGEWRTDNMLNAGNDWRPCEVVYVATAAEKSRGDFRGDYDTVMAAMEHKLSEGYVCPRLVLPAVSAEEVKAKLQQDRLNEIHDY